LQTLAAAISEAPDTLMEVVEPYLLRLGLLERTAQGRVATPRASAWACWNARPRAGWRRPGLMSIWDILHLPATNLRCFLPKRRRGMRNVPFSRNPWGIWYT